jgi:hypothetical protein
MTEMTLTELAELEWWWNNNKDLCWDTANAVALGCVVRPRLPSLLALARRALLETLVQAGRQEAQSAAPTGEVTREHRETVMLAFAGSDDFCLWERRFIDDDPHPITSSGIETVASSSLARVARLLATREQAAYQRGCADTRADARCLQSDMQRIRENLAEERGRQEAQGGWVAVIQDAYDSLTDGDAEGAIRTLRAALPPSALRHGEGRRPVSLRDVIRAEVQRLDRMGFAGVPLALGALRDAGAVQGIHVGRSDLNADETVEWYAGQLVYVLSDKSKWFCVNSIINCLDKFCPDTGECGGK